MFICLYISVTIPENTGVNEPVITVTAIDYDDPSGPGFYGQVHYSLVGKACSVFTGSNFKEGTLFAQYCIKGYRC